MISTAPLSPKSESKRIQNLDQNKHRLLSATRHEIDNAHAHTRTGRRCTVTYVLFTSLFSEQFAALYASLAGGAASPLRTYEISSLDSCNDANIEENQAHQHLNTTEKHHNYPRKSALVHHAHTTTRRLSPPRDETRAYNVFCFMYRLLLCFSAQLYCKEHLLLFYEATLFATVPIQ